MGFRTFLIIGFVSVPVWAFAEETEAEAVSLDPVQEHIQKGRYAEALEACAELAETDADAAALADFKSRALEATGQYEQAEKVLAEAVKDHPKRVELQARLAWIQFTRGRYEEAKKTAREALQQDGRHPLAQLVLTEVFTETGRIREADDGYRWFVRYYNQAQPTDAETLLIVARGASQYARWHSVSQIFGFAVNTLCPDALADDELSWQSYYVSGRLLLEKYNRADALPEFQAALKINPRAAEVLTALGEAAQQNYDLEKAIDYADKALKINPNLVAALQVKADVEIAQGDLAEALKLLEEALQVNPHDQRTLARIAGCYVLVDGVVLDERLEQLFSHLEKIDELELEAPNRFEQLVIDLAKRNPKPGYFLNVLAETLESRRNYRLAKRMYQLAIDTIPQLSEPKVGLGLLSMRTGEVTLAKPILDDAFDADPFHVRVSNMRKVVSLLDDYDTIETEHFIIRIDSSKDRILGEYMAEYLEEIYPTLVKQFGFEPPNKTQFEIYNEAKGTSGHEWFSARMIGLPWIQTVGATTGMIVALTSPNASARQFNWAQVLRHEFVHVITLQQTDFRIPHWFTEALAVRSEGYPRPAEWDELLLERVPKGDLRTLSNLSDGFIRPKDSDDWQFAYCQSELYAEYMIDEYGAESIPKLLAAYAANLPTEKAIPQATGADLETFEKGYVKFLERVVQKIRGGHSSSSKTLAELEKAHLADPENAQAAAEYAYGLMQARKHREARELAEQAHEQNPSEPLAALVLAQLELLAENLTAAAEYLEPALNRDDPHPDLLLLLAKLKAFDEDFELAAELFELGAEKFPSDLDWLRGAAAVYIRMNQAEKLQVVLELLVASDPDDVGVRKRLANLALERDDFEQAVAYGVKALHIDVTDAEVHATLGEAYQELSQPERAIREYRYAVELKSETTEYELGLAKALIAGGKKSEAKTQLEAILMRVPDETEAKALMKKLDAE